MSSPSNKKLMLAYIYRILKEYSDENHPLTQQDIIVKLRSLFGMECERKAIAANLQNLEELGANIQRLPNRGVYLAGRTFEPSEVTFLVDAVFSSKGISSRHSQELAEKLFQDFSIYQRKKYNYVYKADRIVRSDNRQTFYCIELLQDAIAQNRKVFFHYIHHGLQGKIQQPTTVSPYYLINSNGKYYLVCYNPDHRSLSNYRVSRIANVQITESPAIPIQQVPGCGPGFDIAEYANENIYMFGMGAVVAEMAIRDPTGITYIRDWFGSGATILERDGQVLARVKADEQALIYWAVQYGDFVELLSPDSTRQKIINMIGRLNTTYGGGR